jgi:hypothetical protein
MPMTGAETLHFARDVSPSPPANADPTPLAIQRMITSRCESTGDPNNGVGTS